MLRKSPRLPTSAPPYIVPGTLGGPTNTTPELPRRRKTIRSARLGPRSSGRTHRFLLQFTKIRYGRDKRTSPAGHRGRGGRARASGDGRLTLVGSNRRDYSLPSRCGALSLVDSTGRLPRARESAPHSVLLAQPHAGNGARAPPIALREAGPPPAFVENVQPREPRPRHQVGRV